MEHSLVDIEDLIKAIRAFETIRDYLPDDENLHPHDREAIVEITNLIWKHNIHGSLL